jgi:RHS repeat-associated protein
MPKRFCCETVSCGTFDRLEPDEGKLSRPVLRGGGDGDVASLPGGETLSSSGEGTTSYGFTGEWTDSYIELLYLRSRMYSPRTGRFITKDVWQGDYTRPMSYNGWLYIYANPINFTDSTGYIPDGFLVGRLTNVTGGVPILNLIRLFSPCTLPNQELFNVMGCGTEACQVALREKYYANADN